MSFSDPISPIQPSSAEVEPSSGQSPFTVSTPNSAAAQASKAFDEDPIWRPLDVVIIALFAVLAIFVVGNLAVAIAHYLPRFHNVKVKDLIESAAVIVPAETVAYLFLLAFMTHIVRLRNRRERAFWDGLTIPAHVAQGVPAADSNFLTLIRWNMPSEQRAWLALLGGAGLALASAVFESVLHKWIPKGLPIDQIIHDRSSAYLFALFSVLVAPFIEELFFRGFLYPVLAKKLEQGIAIVLTAAAFAVIHQGQLAHAWVPLLWLFLVGLILTYVRARTKSVATSVLIHVSYNGTLFGLLYFATQGFRHF